MCINDFVVVEDVVVRVVLLVVVVVVAVVAVVVIGLGDCVGVVDFIEVYLKAYVDVLYSTKTSVHVNILGYINTSAPFCL